MIEAIPIWFAGVALTVYLLASQTTKWPARRTTAFVSGNLVLVLALVIGSPTLVWHMVEHGLVIAVAAPLMILGSPVTLALKTLRPDRRTRLLRILRSRPLAILTHPAFTWPLFVATQWVLHLTPLLEASETRPLLHGFEHFILFGTALLFWAPVLGADPLPHKLRGAARSAYLFAAAPAVDLAAAIFISQGHELAGAVMLASMLPVGTAGAVLTWSWMTDEQRRVNRKEATGVPI